MVEQIYQIRVEGQIGERWAHWFDDMSLVIDDDKTILTGPVADQAALWGHLQKLYTLGLPLVSVERYLLEEGT